MLVLYSAEKNEIKDNSLNINHFFPFCSIETGFRPIKTLRFLRFALKYIQPTKSIFGWLNEIVGAFREIEVRGGLPFFNMKLQGFLG